MDVLVGAEAYGFGPSSKALALARELRYLGHRLHFIGNGSALAAAKAEEGIFVTLTDDSSATLAEVGDHVRRADLVISVMEPSIAFAAVLESQPLAYIDSLFWMWNWPADLTDPSSRTEAAVVALLTGNRPQAERLIADLTMHEEQYVAHRVASILLVQRYGRPTGSIDTARASFAAVEVGAIVDDGTSRRTKYPVPSLNGGAENTFMMSLSGLANVLTSEEDAMQWAVSVVGVIDDVLVANPNSEVAVRVGGNPSLLRDLPRPRSPKLRLRPWESHESFMRDLASTKGLLASPGITSMAEAWSLNVPFLALPSQHYAHSSILGRIEAISQGAVPRVVADSPTDLADPEGSTRSVMARVVEQLAPGTPAYSGALAGVAGFLLADDREREAIRAAQDEVFKETFGSASGTSEIVNQLIEGIEQW